MISLKSFIPEIKIIPNIKLNNLTDLLQFINKYKEQILNIIYDINWSKFQDIDKKIFISEFMGTEAFIYENEVVALPLLEDSEYYGLSLSFGLNEIIYRGEPEEIINSGFIKVFGKKIFYELVNF